MYKRRNHCCPVISVRQTSEITGTIFTPGMAWLGIEPMTSQAQLSRQLMVMHTTKFYTAHTDAHTQEWSDGETKLNLNAPKHAQKVGIIEKSNKIPLVDTKMHGR